MPRAAKLEIEEEPKWDTLQVPRAVKQILQDEQVARMGKKAKRRSVSYGRLLAELIAEAWGKPEYIKILKEAGLLD